MHFWIRPLGGAGRFSIRYSFLSVRVLSVLRTQLGQLEAAHAGIPRRGFELAAGSVRRASHGTTAPVGSPSVCSCLRALAPWARPSWLSNYQDRPGGLEAILPRRRHQLGNVGAVCMFPRDDRTVTELARSLLRTTSLTEQCSKDSPESGERCATPGLGRVS